MAGLPGGCRRPVVGVWSGGRWRVSAPSVSLGSDFFRMFPAGCGRFPS